MKRLFVIVAALALILSACGSVKYSPEFQQIYDQYIADRTESAELGWNETMALLEAYYYASNYETAYNATDLSGVPDMFAKSAAYMIVVFKKNSQGYKLGKDTWDALSYLDSGDIEEYQKRMVECKTLWETISKDTMDNFLATHTEHSIIQALGAGR